MFEHVLIVGVGLLGGSLGLALRSRGLAKRVVGIGRSSDRLQKAVDVGAITEFHLLDDPWRAEGGLVVLAAPVEQIGLLLEAHRSKISDDTIVTDVGSTKTRIVESCEQILGAGNNFVGSHPMAGSHNTGVMHADRDLFENRVCIVTPTEQTDAQSTARVVELWQGVGMKVIQLSPEEHDRLAARTSHLPHMAASALCSLLGRNSHPNLTDLVGAGFRDTTRLAAGGPELWAEICQHNQREIVAAIGELMDELASLKDLLDREDFAEVESFLERARIERLRLCERIDRDNSST